MKARRASIVSRLLWPLLILVCAFVGLLIWISDRTLSGVAEIQQDATRTAITTDQSIKKTIRLSNDASKLSITRQVRSVASDIELLLTAYPSLKADPARLAERSEVKRISTEVVGKGGYVCVIEPEKDQVVVHNYLDSGARISENLPELARALEDTAYLKELAAYRARSNGLVSEQFIRVHEVAAGKGDQAHEGSVWVLTPIGATNLTVAVFAPMSGLQRTILQEVGDAVRVVNDNLSAINARSDRLRRIYRTTVGLVLALGVLFVGGVLLYVRRQLKRPIDHLTATAERIQKGDVAVRSELQTGDELQTLGDAFNRMVEQIVAKSQALEHLNQNLESEVRARTRALEASNQDLQKLMAELRALDEMKRHFYTNVSHELRTPLTLILGFIRQTLARIGSTDEVAARDLETAQRNAAHLLREINDLLDVARLEAGRMTLAAAPVDLVALVREVAANFAPSQPGGRRLTVEEAGAPLIVHLDTDKARKIVYNLLSNAFKFTDETTGRVVVRVRAAGESVVLEVEDNGIGIAPESLAHIFERFKQADSSTTRKFEGTGIGLALVKEIAELHGAYVEVRSRLGAGSTFQVTFRTGRAHLRDDQVQESPPPSDAVEVLQRLAAPRAAPAVLSLPTPGARKEDAADILVVEDHRDLREYLVRLLAGHDVRAAADGAEALERVKERVPQLIVSDVMMPRVDGYELCAAIKNDPATAHVPIILLTAQAGLTPKMRGLEARADDYLNKPFQEEELLARIRNLLLIEKQRVELREINRRLEVRVLEQADALSRRGRLRRFLPTDVADQLLEDGAEAALERKRRTVAVLAAELDGFEALAAAVGPEDLTVLFGRFHTIVTEVVFRGGGTIVSLHNGAVQALFGAPVEQSEQEVACAAVRAGRELLQAVGTLADAWRELAPANPLLLRGGVEVGEAIAGAFGDGEWASFAAVGGPAARAPLLRQEAQPGEIMVGARAARLVVDEQLEGPLALMVGSQTHQAWRLRLQAERARPAPTQTEERAATRSDELAATIDHTRRDEALPSVPLGQMLGGRYLIERELGRGGMGSVYVADDLLLGERIALKVLHRHSSGDRDRLDRLRREVRLARLVTHPNVCRVFDLQLVEDKPCLTMEYIDGRSLRSIVQEGRVDMAVALDWARQLCDGLAAAHACGIVHRDLKPDNVLVEKTGRAVIADFGIARPAGMPADPAAGIAGTMDYLAPEQLSSGNSPDTRTDIYSLGVLLFELFTGQLPFPGERPLERMMARSIALPVDPAKLVPSLDPRIRAVILRCLCRDIGQRFQRIGDVQAALASVAKTEARPPSMASGAGG